MVVWQAGREVLCSVWQVRELCHHAMRLGTGSPVLTYAYAFVPGGGSLSRMPVLSVRGRGGPGMVLRTCYALFFTAPCLVLLAPCLVLIFSVFVPGGEMGH